MGATYVLGLFNTNSIHLKKISVGWIFICLASNSSQLLGAVLCQTCEYARSYAFKILRAASLPVRTDMGTPAGLYVHCPA